MITNYFLYILIYRSKNATFVAFFLFIIVTSLKIRGFLRKKEQYDKQSNITVDYGSFFLLLFRFSFDKI
jgi:hypothetical protein